MKFLVTFEYKSYYEDESENKVAKNTLEYEADNYDELLIIVDEEDYDDEIVINFNAKSNCDATERDYIKIVDEDNKVLLEDN